MKVFFCTYDCNNCINGVNAWLQKLLPQLQCEGIQVQVLFINWTPQQSCTTISILRDKGIKCDEIPFLYDITKQVNWILKKIATDPPDIFIASDVLPALYASRWLQEAGTPCLTILHIDNEQSRGIIEQFASDKSPHPISGVVCVSKRLEQLALQKRKSTTRVWRIPYGTFLPQELASVPLNKLKLVYLGRLAEEQKSISATVTAMCKAAREIPNIEGIIYGNGPEETLVKQILQEQGTDIPIKLFGIIENIKVQKYLLKSHVLVLLSDYEGLPVALLEAMACGLVPICLKTDSGISELVEHGITGLIVNNRQDSFISQVRRLYQSPRLWKSISTAARLKVEQEYSHDFCMAQWMQVLFELYQNIKIKKNINIPVNIDIFPVHCFLKNMIICD